MGQFLYDEAVGPAAAKDWTVYLVRCRDGSLYAGIAKDLRLRLAKHNGGKGGAYTRSRKPVRLAHREDGFSRSQALKREFAIKALSRRAKLALISASGRGRGPAVIK